MTLFFSFFSSVQYDFLISDPIGAALTCRHFIKSTVIAYADEKPVGFAYGAVSQVTLEHITVKPEWAKKLDGNGFYPSDYDIPKPIGTFKLLYVDENYRGLKIGKRLSDDLMVWLKSRDVEDLWVYVANGNEKVGKFYEGYGFNFSHSVYSGFIDAYKQEL